MADGTAAVAEKAALAAVRMTVLAGRNPSFGVLLAAGLLVLDFGGFGFPVA